MLGWKTIISFMSRPIFRGRTVELPQGVIHKIQEPNGGGGNFFIIFPDIPWIFGKTDNNLVICVGFMCHSYVGLWGSESELYRQVATFHWCGQALFGFFLMFVELRSSYVVRYGKMEQKSGKLTSWYGESIIMIRGFYVFQVVVWDFWTIKSIPK